MRRALLSAQTLGGFAIGVGLVTEFCLYDGKHV
jgi:hypothetical protein